MSLDIKYRPRTYDDVLGQKPTIQIVRRLVATGKQFQQSYLFAGPWGSGKTTVARIFARAMLCDAPIEGNPCDQCDSCVGILTDGTSESLTEVDAANNSGKDDVRKVLEEIEYGTLGGKRRVYIYDESHELSRGSLDALLKSMEETFQGSEDKRLVCIFCTTEPEKMRATVLSRCAPAFIIHPVSPKEVAERLAHVCQAENLEYDLSALQLIAEMTECHVRDGLKAVDGVAMLGPIDSPNVGLYMHLDRNVLYLDVLDSLLGGDFRNVSRALGDLLQRASATTCYEKLAEVALLAYKVSVGACQAPGHWDAERITRIGVRLGQALLAIAGTLASRPGRVTAAMLECDLAYLHHRGCSPVLEATAMSFLPSLPVNQSSSTVVPLPSPATIPAENTPPKTVLPTNINLPVAIPPKDGTLSVSGPVLGATLQGGTYIDGRAVKPNPTGPVAVVAAHPLELDTQMFIHFVLMRIHDLEEAERGPTGHSHMDRH